MNWNEAVSAMRLGKRVQRESERRHEPIGSICGLMVYESGQEPVMLAHAWTADERPVMVFRGAESGVLFVPDAEHRMADDWVIV